MQRPLPGRAYLLAIVTDEAAAIEVMAQMRWPHGFRCPHCQHRHATKLNGRPVWKCHGCKKQVRLTANTPLHGTHVPLRKWLVAIYAVARKRSISALQLSKDIKVAETTAMFMLRRIRHRLGDRDGPPLFRGKLEHLVVALGEDDARPAPVAATEQLRQHQSLIIAIERLGGLAPERGPWDGRELRRGSRRGRRRKRQGPRDRCGHIRLAAIPTGTLPAHFLRRAIAAGRHSVEPMLPMAGIIARNFIALVRGTFHGVSRKHLAMYVREFVYRFNRRHLEPHLPVLIARRLLRGAPLPIAALKQTAPSFELRDDELPPPPTSPTPAQPAPPPPPPRDELDELLDLLADPTKAEAAQALLRARRVAATATATATPERDVAGAKCAGHDVIHRDADEIRGSGW